MFRDQKIKEPMSVLFTRISDVCKICPCPTLSPCAIESSWSFDPRAVQWLCFRLFCAMVAYCLHPSWGSSVLQTTLAPVQSPYKHSGGILLSLSSSSSVELPLDAGDLNPDLPEFITANQSLTHWSKLEVTLIKVLWFLYVGGFVYCRCPSTSTWQSPIHKRSVSSIDPLKKAPWV